MRNLNVTPRSVLDAYRQYSEIGTIEAGGIRGTADVIRSVRWVCDAVGYREAESRPLMPIQRNTSRTSFHPLRIVCAHASKGISGCLLGFLVQSRLQQRQPRAAWHR